LYDSGNGTINAEVTGRTTQIEVNADGTKTMLTGGTKTAFLYFMKNTKNIKNAK
jgi:hypothetical protein